MTTTLRGIVALLGACFLGSGPCHADSLMFPVDYATGGASYTGLGKQYDSVYDILKLLPKATASINGAGPYLLNDVYFEYGLNSNSEHTDTGTLSEDLTLDGLAPITLTFPFSIFIAARDTISISGITVLVPGLKIVVNPLTLTAVQDYYDHNTGQLWMTVSAVPVPGALPLFASGLACLGWLGRRRQKQLPSLAT